MYTHLWDLKSISTFVSDLHFSGNEEVHGWCLWVYIFMTLQAFFIFLMKDLLGLKPKNSKLDPQKDFQFLLDTILVECRKCFDIGETFLMSLTILQQGLVAVSRAVFSIYSRIH